MALVPAGRLSKSFFPLETIPQFDSNFGENMIAFLNTWRKTGDSESAIYCCTVKHLVAIPLYVLVEEVKHRSSCPCYPCAYAGWSHHLLSNKSYHFIIPWEWHKSPTLDEKHHLHGIIHSNGFGHLVMISSREGRRVNIAGHSLMEIWDRLCDSLRVRAISLRDVSTKNSMCLRLLFGVAYSQSWFGKFGYQFCRGSYGVDQQAYESSIEELGSAKLDALVLESARYGWDRGELRKLVSRYRKLAHQTQNLDTTRDLLSYVIKLKCLRPMEFAESLEGEDYSFSSEELQTAAETIVNLLKEQKVMNSTLIHAGVSDTLSDPNLVNQVLRKAINFVIGEHIIKKSRNTATGVFEFTVVRAVSGPRQSQIVQDMNCLYKRLMLAKPKAAQVVLDSKVWVKNWVVPSERYVLCRWKLMEEELKGRQSPPPVVVVRRPFGRAKDLKTDAERAMRDTYCLLKEFRAVEVEDMNLNDEVQLTVEAVNVKGEIMNFDLEQQIYTGGRNTWIVSCVCGAKDDDGEAMIECETCGVWFHYRCMGFADDEKPFKFRCSSPCGGFLIEEEEEEEEPV